MNFSTSLELFERAKQFIPGGVNSPVRAFKAVGGNPVFIKRAKGAYLYDEDNNEYIDLINSWGPMILGHAHPLVEEAVKEALYNSPSFGAPTRREVEMAQLIRSLMPGVEKVRLVNSGTEATMSAIRLARGYTRRDKIIKMEGCYHGHGDSFLIAAGSGAMTLGVPDSPGVTKGTAQDTLLAPFNNLNKVEQIFKESPGEVAAVIVEPVAGNMGCVSPGEGYLAGLKELCHRYGVLIIFDEVMTGFRLSQGGAQQKYGVQPDITCLGKIIGGGLPVGAYGGRAEIMDTISPVGPVYQAGTLSGNPLAVAAGLAMLTYLSQHPEVYTQIDTTAETLHTGLLERFAKWNVPVRINRDGSMMTVFFSFDPVTDLDSAKKADTQLFARYFQGMLHEGVYLPPSQFEAMFISAAIGAEETEKIFLATERVLDHIRSSGFIYN